MAKYLPVFRLRRPQVDGDVVTRLAASVLGEERVGVRARDGWLVGGCGPFSTEVNRNSGGVWLADCESLWNVEDRPKLPSREQATSIGMEVMERAGVLPVLGDGFVLDDAHVASSLAAIQGEGCEREDRVLDVQVSVGVGVEVNHPGVDGPVPMVGGGGRMSLTLGDGGRPIGMSGVWRPVDDGFSVRVVDQQDADERFLRLHRGVKVESFHSRLAYYAAPASATQDYLYPVYVYSAQGRFDEELVPLRQILLPATEFGPRVAPQQPQRPRDVPGCGEYLAPATATSLTATSLAAATSLTATSVRAPLRSYYEAGTSWIGQSGGLSGSEHNAQGFVDELAADGWSINFNWGDANAWESDWRRNDDSWVDAADFVFYTGHASKNGWVLANPDDEFLHFTEVGNAPESPGDRWGQQDLEWAVIAACGPLQDEILASGGGNVFDRWRGVFDGLHTLLGYGEVTYDNTEEGRRLVQYARDGQPIIDAWFRTAKEIQPSTVGPDGPTIYAGALYAYRSGQTSPRYDHLHGHGSVAFDPISPDVRVCIWTPT